MPWTPSAFPKKERPRRQVINQVLPTLVKAWEDGTLRSKECRSLPRGTNAGLFQHSCLAASTNCNQAKTYPTLAPSAEAVEYADCISAVGKNSLKEYPRYDTKQSDGEDPVKQELWGMRSTTSLPLLPG